MSILGKAVRTEEWSLLCTHEEADIRILFHILRLENQRYFTMRTADTDCLINEVGCSEKLDTSLKIWLEVGVWSRYNMRFISVDSIHSSLGKVSAKRFP